MPQDYPRQVIDAFLLSAAGTVFKASVTNLDGHQREEVEPIYSVPFDEVVRIAMKGKYDVATIGKLDDGTLKVFRNESWSIPRDRVLQFASLLRYMGSLEHPWEAKPPLSATQIVGMADAWALRQGLFQEDDSPAIG